MEKMTVTVSDWPNVRCCVTQGTYYINRAWDVKRYPEAKNVITVIFQNIDMLTQERIRQKHKRLNGRKMLSYQRQAL